MTCHCPVTFPPDLGTKVEQDLIADWTSNGDQPEITGLTMISKPAGEGYEIRTDIAGTTAQWRRSNDQRWRLLNAPLPNGHNTAQILIERIGYTPLDTVISLK